ncbi:hypothetical protein D3C71_1454830 [compost metagenome]
MKKKTRAYIVEKKLIFFETTVKYRHERIDDVFHDRVLDVCTRGNVEAIQLLCSNLFLKRIKSSPRDMKVHTIEWRLEVRSPDSRIIVKREIAFFTSGKVHFGAIDPQLTLIVAQLSGQHKGVLLHMVTRKPVPGRFAFNSRD